MASIARDPGGKKRIIFIDASGTRRTIRLGKCDVKSAEAFRLRLERLLSTRTTGTAPDGDLSRWLADLPDAIHDRLARTGLVEPRIAQSRDLKRFLDDYFETLDVKPSTRTRYGQTRRLLAEHFGEDHDIRTITPRDADRWRAWLVERGYAPAKVAREVGIARMMFRQAARWGTIDANPFEGVKAGSQHNRERLHYVPPETAAKLIDAAPNPDWRCIIALARWGGLRCPSEVLRVRWVDVDWNAGRLRVTSPKTEEHAGKGQRIIPLFPELRAVLMEAFEQAEPGAEHVISRYRDATNANLRTHLLRIIDRAGVTAWPRLFNAMRASRATELAAEYPAAVCTAWMGHSAAIAEAHYHMVRDSDYERAAAQNAAQQPTASDCKASQSKPGEPALEAVNEGAPIGATYCETGKWAILDSNQ